MKTAAIHANITASHDDAPCLMCQRQGQAVTISFASGFLTNAILCWKCVREAFRIQLEQETAQHETSASSPIRSAG